MKLSVIFADSRIVKDGLGYAVTLPDEPDIWAIQWHGSAGHIEYRDPATLNDTFDDEALISPYVALWNAAHAEATFVPVPTFAELKATKAKLLADYRWQRTQIMNYDGETDVPADPALSVITSIAVGEQFAPSNGATRTFKLKANVFRTWNVSQIVTYGIAIGNHVQACFNREKALYAQVQAAADEAALNAIDITVGWP